LCVLRRQPRQASPERTGRARVSVPGKIPAFEHAALEVQAGLTRDEPVLSYGLTAVLDDVRPRPEAGAASVCWPLPGRSRWRTCPPTGAMSASSCSAR
jgi:hypothetical protein